ncbi:MAG: DUF1127 domain-containing protein [Nitratireductor sp.]|nr:DUF1127 domain-containing protein [Nitratireductor sp.]
MSTTANLFGTIRRLVRNRRAQREHQATIRAISALPPETLKDIGWPGAYEGRMTRRH